MALEHIKKDGTETGATAADKINLSFDEVDRLGTDKADKTYVDNKTSKAVIDALDINAKTVNGHTVDADVPSGAKFTDTVYDDTQIKADIALKADKSYVDSSYAKLPVHFSGTTVPDDTLGKDGDIYFKV